MKVNELSKELGVTNKDVIDFLKSNGFKVSSHMQNVTNEMIELAHDQFKSIAAEEEVEETITTKNNSQTPTKQISAREIKRFQPDDQIPCRSAVPWKLVGAGVDKNSLYVWNSFGDREYVLYRDLQSMRRKGIVKNAQIIIEDPDICEQWKYDLGDAYQKYLGVEYPEEFFDMPDDKFEKTLKDAPDTFKEVIKYTAIDMIRNENYPSIQKLTIIDNVLGTGIKEFI